MIDPLLRERVRPSVEPTGTARRSPRGRGLRVAGAAGMGSLMVVTGYMTGSAGQQATGSTSSTTAVAAASAAAVATTLAPATTSAPAAVATSTVAPTTTTPPCTATYTVAAGDSWVGIAHRASVVVDILYVLNGSSAETVIHPGDSICIPNGVVVATTTSTTSTTAPATTAAPATTQVPVVTTPVVAIPAAPAAQPASNSGGS